MMRSLSLRLSVFVNYSEESWEITDMDNNTLHVELPFYTPNPTSDNITVSNDLSDTNQVEIDQMKDVSRRDELPMAFTKVSSGQWPIIFAYTVVFCVAAVGNFTEFVFVWRRLRKRSTAMNRLLLHLCVADIVVVFMVAAVEVFWRISIGWYAGDLLCKVIQYFRAFGLYLSSLMLICLSLDRFYAVVYPLRTVDASRRVKIMLTIAWTTAALCASPQCIVFQVQSHPIFPAFKQCNSILSGVTAEAINTAISLSFMYFLPILVIIFSYGSIVIKLMETENADRFLRRSGASVMDRAKIKTLKLSFVIVMVFAVCWTPYVVISIWHIWDRESAEKVNPYIQESLFICAVANSSVNPLVYGIFNSKRSSRQRTSVSRTTINESRRKPGNNTVMTRGRSLGSNMLTPNSFGRKTSSTRLPEESQYVSDVSPNFNHEGSININNCHSHAKCDS